VGGWNYKTRTNCRRGFRDNAKTQGQYCTANDGERTRYDAKFIADTKPTAVARSVETGLNLIGAAEAAQTIHQGQATLEATTHNVAVALEAADLVLQDAANFLQPIVTSESLLTSSQTNQLAGSTTTDEIAASEARVSSSATVQDLQSAAGWRHSWRRHRIHYQQQTRPFLGATSKKAVVAFKID